jgi:hypothetical protein
MFYDYYCLKKRELGRHYWPVGLELVDSLLVTLFYWCWLLFGDKTLNEFLFDKDSEFLLF